MKLVIDREQFAHAFQLVAAVVPLREAREVLHNVKVVATNQGLLLQATDMELGIRYHMTDVEITHPGEILLPTKHVRRILQESRDKTITLEQTDEGLTVRGVRSVFTFPTPATEEFPTVEEFSSKAPAYSLNAQSLKKIIQHTVFATDAENTRYQAIAGVLFEIDEEDMLHVVATDGRRLAYETYQGKWHNKTAKLAKDKAKAAKKGDSEGESAKSSVEHYDSNPRDAGSVIPPKALQLVERTIDSIDGDVSVAIAENRIIFKVGHVEVSTKLIDGLFPKWRRILPKREEREEISIVAESLHSAVRQAAIVTTEMNHGVFFEFDMGKLILTAQGAETGKSQVELPISETPADPATLKFKIDPKFLQQFLKVLGPDEVVSMFAAGSDPLLFCFGETYQYIVMPLFQGHQS